MDTLKLVTSPTKNQADAVNKLRDSVEKFIGERGVVGYALVVMHPDNSSSVSTFGCSSRLTMLGAVNDLAYTIMKDGDG